MNESFTCVYCGIDKPIADRSLEHVWPEALGGQSGPEFFKTRDVCHRCNNLSGLFVDGEFIRSFFSSVEEFQGGLHYVDTAKPGPLPLIFLGQFVDPPPADGEICESWLGPRGERIFYFHKADRADFGAFAAGDPIRRRREDAGRVYLSFARANMYWIATAVMSVKQTFKAAPLRLLTQTNDPGLNAECTPEDDLSARDRAYIAPLLAQKAPRTRMTISVDHGLRFQCKLALGFGHTLFGASFGETQYATELRRGLWERDPEKRKQLKVFGTPLLANLRDYDESILGMTGAYTFAFLRVPNGAMSLVYGPSTRSLRTMIASNAPTLKSGILDPVGGAVVVLLPGLRRHFGPMPLVSYVLHRGGGPKIEALAELESSHQSIEAIEAAVKKWDVPQ